MNLPFAVRENEEEGFMHSYFLAHSLALSCTSRDNSNMTLTFIVEDVVGVIGCSVGGGGVVEVAE